MHIEVVARSDFKAEVFVGKGVGDGVQQNIVLVVWWADYFYGKNRILKIYCLKGELGCCI